MENLFKVSWSNSLDIDFDRLPENDEVRMYYLTYWSDSGDGSERNYSFLEMIILAG